MDAFTLKPYKFDPAILRGSGSEDDPFILDFAPNDPSNPLNFPRWRKWFILVTMAIGTLALGFASSAYTGAVEEIIIFWRVKEIVAVLGVSLFVLGFALGPLLWAPLSEQYGRRQTFLVSYIPFVIFGGCCAASKNITTLLVLRFFQGTFGSSTLVNPGGTIADMFSANERGPAVAIFALMPFLGPVIGPIAGGFLGQYKGWKWIFYVMTIFSGALLILQFFIVPETYAPYLVERVAQRKSKETGKVYISKYEAGQPKLTLQQQLEVILARPFKLLFLEPIVMLLSIYMSIIYGTLYLEFTAFPIVFHQERGWSPGITGLAYIGIGVGMVMGVALAVLFNRRYIKIAEREGGIAPPEARLEMAMLGGVLLPIGLFWFAWTTYTSIHWIVPILGTAPFGAGMIMLFLSMMTYLVDSYLMYAASVLAANSVLRSLFAFAFPLFGPYMYQNLGTQWASCLVAFLALACVPLPFIFYKYGARIRKLSKNAPEDLHALMKARQAAAEGKQQDDEKTLDSANGEISQHERDIEKADGHIEQSKDQATDDYVKERSVV